MRACNSTGYGLHAGKFKLADCTAKIELSPNGRVKKAVCINTE